MLEVLRLERLAEQGIGAKINHSGREIIAGLPIGMHVSQLFGRKR
jgi:hypothetical protein